MGAWYERISGRLPDADVVRELVESVEQLPGLDRWCPPLGLENHWSDLIRWGFPLLMTRSLDGVDSLHRSVAADILASHGPSAESFAELSGAGACVGLGAVGGRRIPRSIGRTADWRLVWPDDAAVDVEVTVARRKEKHIVRQTLARDLATTLFRAERDFDLLVDVADPTIREDRDAIVAIADSIAVGRVESLAGRWQLRSQEIARGVTTVLAGSEDVRPPWWSATAARCFVVHQFLAGPDAHRAPPQVRVCFGVPYDSYVNPIMRKADFPQGEAGLPFLLAVDIAGLPGAFQEMPRVVADFFPNWRAVSGILLFQDMMGVDRVGWMWRLLRNPHADLQLPDTLCSGRADLPQAMETGARLSKERGAA